MDSMNLSKVFDVVSLSKKTVFALEPKNKLLNLVVPFALSWMFALNNSQASATNTMGMVTEPIVQDCQLGNFSYKSCKYLDGMCVSFAICNKRGRHPTLNYEEDGRDTPPDRHSTIFALYFQITTSLPEKDCFSGDFTERNRNYLEIEGDYMEGDMEVDYPAVWHWAEEKQLRKSPDIESQDGFPKKEASVEKKRTGESFFSKILHRLLCCGGTSDYSPEVYPEIPDNVKCRPL